MIAIDAPPEVIADSWIFPGPYLADVKAMIDYHVNNPEESLYGGEDGDLTVDFPFAASVGPVPKHTDIFDGESEGKRIFGLVVENTGNHRLHSESMAGSEGLPLPVGAFYSLDPYDPHWTTCDDPEGRLTFIVTFFPPTDVRYGNVQRVAHDLFWESLDAVMRHRRMIEQEKQVYAGIASVREAPEP